MSGLDVEALLESAAKSSTPTKEREERSDDRHKSDRSDRRERDRARDGSRDRDRDRKRRDRSRERRHREPEGDVDMKSPRSDKGSATGSLRSSRRRSRSRDSDRRHSRRERHREGDGAEDPYAASSGDYYRGGGRARSRSRSPDDDRYYRPSGKGRDERDGERERHRDRDGDRDRHRRDDRRPREREGRRSSPSAAKRERSKSKEPQLTEDERDRRTVFVQQLAARLRTKELIQFFEKIGPVQEAQIVKDRVSGRSKGVGYVEFKQEESVPLAIQLTGQKLLGIPIIAQLTEAEKNRQARTQEGTSSANAGIPFHRLYVGNIHFSITESDLQNVFEPFGELEFVQLQKEEGGRSRGYGFVQ